MLIPVWLNTCSCRVQLAHEIVSTDSIAPSSGTDDDGIAAVGLGEDDRIVEPEK